jgi:hypothetical protein
VSESDIDRTEAEADLDRIDAEEQQDKSETAEDGHLRPTKPRLRVNSLDSSAEHGGAYSI